MTSPAAMQGDIRKVRTAILLGVAVPLAMFLSWDAAVLGNMAVAVDAGATAAAGAALRASSQNLPHRYYMQRISKLQPSRK